MPEEILSKEEMKQIVKEAHKEVLREEIQKTYEGVGRWTMRIFLTAVVGAVYYFVLAINGWHHK